MTTKVETYKKPWDPAVTGLQARAHRWSDVSQEAWKLEAETKLPLYRELGLHALAQKVDTNLTWLAAGHAIPFPLLTAHEIAVWQRFLPTSYKGWMQLQKYEFDQPPLDVLTLWQDVKKAEMFETYEIRTPEQPKRPDPVLWGYTRHGVGPFMLARWGESLVSFEEIEAKVSQSRTVSGGGAITMPIAQWPPFLAPAGTRLLGDGPGVLKTLTTTNDWTGFEFLPNGGRF